MASLAAFAMRIFTTVFAAILIFSPVFGIDAGPGFALLLHQFADAGNDELPFLFRLGVGQMTSVSRKRMAVLRVVSVDSASLLRTSDLVSALAAI